jgi:hypothetical protein
MKDLILIGDYSNTKEKKDLLLDLVNFFKENGKEVMISSHIAPEEIILRKCDYFIYDKENKLLTDKKYIGYSSFSSQLVDLASKLPARQNTFLAVMRILFNGFTMAKTLKYDVVHYVEYDSKISSIKEFNENLNILRSSNYNAVGYFNQDWMSGNYLCINLNKLNYSDFLYDENKLLENLDILCEEFLHTRFLKNNVYKKDFNLIATNENFSTGLCSGDFLYWGIVFPHNSEYYVLCYNYSKEPMIFNVIEDNNVHNFWLDSRNFNLIKLKKNTHYVKIFGNNMLYMDVDLHDANTQKFLEESTTVSKLI